MKVGQVLVFLILSLRVPAQNFYFYQHGQLDVPIDSRQSAFGGIDLDLDTNYSILSIDHNPSLLGFNKGRFGVCLTGMPALSEDMLARYFGSAAVKVRLFKNATFGYSYRRHFYANPWDQINCNAHTMSIGIRLIEKYCIGFSVVPVNQKWGLPKSTNYLVISDVLFNLGATRIDSVDLKCGDLLIGTSLFVSNFGTKVPDTRNYMPTRLNLAGVIRLSQKKSGKYRWHQTLGVQFVKYLVPTPPLYYQYGEVMENGDTALMPETYVKDGYENINLSTVHAMFQSFYDAPGGFSEEISEVGLNLGYQFCLQTERANWFASCGYFYGNESKLYLTFPTFGIGAKFRKIYINMHYSMTDKSNEMYIKYGLQLGINL